MQQPPETKICSKCNRRKRITLFTKDIVRVDGLYPWCNRCRVKYKQGKNVPHVTDDASKTCNWCDASIGGTHPNRKHCSNSCKDKVKRVTNYGLTLEQFKLLVKQADGKCPICKRNTLKWNIDHDHKTGEVYGICCAICNSELLAWTFHNIKVAESLVEFLKNPPARQFGTVIVTDVQKRISDYSKKKRMAKGPWLWRRK